MTKTLLFIATLGLTACASQPKPFKTPDGGQGYSMQCKGVGHSVQSCYQDLGQNCPAGYKLLSDEDIREPDLVTPKLYVTREKQFIAVECTPPKAAQ